MKRGFIILVILIFSLNFIFADCINSDSDVNHPDGRNYYMKGNFSGIYQGEQKTGEEICLKDNVNIDLKNAGESLAEAYCLDGNLEYEIYNCTTKCEDGKCVEEQMEINTNIEIDKNQLPEYVPGQLIVKLKKSDPTILDSLNKEYNLIGYEKFFELNYGKSFFEKIKWNLGFGDSDEKELENIYIFYFPADKEINFLAGEYEKNENVIYAEPNYFSFLTGSDDYSIPEETDYSSSDYPNDPYFKYQWAHDNSQITDAWKITSGSPDTIIAVIDTGVDYHHEDLKKNLWINEGEISAYKNILKDTNNNGVIDCEDLFSDSNSFVMDGNDNDNNGYIDDVCGWSFGLNIKDMLNLIGEPDINNVNKKNLLPEIEENNDIFGRTMHGTMTAGIIEAEVNNGLGVAGVCPNCKVMVLKIEAVDETTGELVNLAATTRAIKYAIDNGAKIISMSYGSVNFAESEQDIINYANKKGVILVAGSGNSNTEIEFYPAYYSGVIAVSATNNENKKADYSCYGKRIDISAPGGEIINADYWTYNPFVNSNNLKPKYTGVLTTYPGNKYIETTGTSLSTPYVAGVIGLLLSKQNYNPDEVKYILEKTSTPTLQFYDKKELEDISYGTAKEIISQISDEDSKEGVMKISIEFITRIGTKFGFNSKYEINQVEEVIRDLANENKNDYSKLNFLRKIDEKFSTDISTKLGTGIVNAGKALEYNEPIEFPAKIYSPNSDEIIGTPFRVEFSADGEEYVLYYKIVTEAKGLVTPSWIEVEKGSYISIEKLSKEIDVEEWNPGYNGEITLMLKVKKDGKVFTDYQNFLYYPNLENNL